MTEVILSLTGEKIITEEIMIQDIITGEMVTAPGITEETIITQIMTGEITMSLEIIAKVTTALHLIGNMMSLETVGMITELITEIIV